MKNFTTLFPPVVLLAVWLVLLFSIIQIRRVLVPLEELRKGTKRIAKRDFDSRVRVESDDEFEELAGSFNTMATQLDRQFTALSTMAEIDRVILGTLNTREIVDTLLARIPEIVSCECVGITLPRTKEIDQVRTHLSNEGLHNDLVNEVFDLQASEVEVLADHPDGALVASKNFPVFLTPLVARGIESAWVLPIFLETKLSAVLALGYKQPAAPNEEDKAQIHQLADRVAVALSNIGLLEELDQLSWGALVSLARAIDAKSPWTRGHCERAAEMAVKIGQVFELGPKELDDLHRGALLHDIGKIAVPKSVLDKTGKLTDEEKEIMQEHPRKGARILEANTDYKGIIPVVAQHHEWWDGTGYPYKLAGEGIELSARIYSVADVYDALVSDRPYRKGLTRQEVVEYIKDKSGRQFDPHVVQAFLKVMEKEKDEPINKKLTASPLLTS
jgi:putative nucleotidyltransferase with HDIG domain